MHEQADQTRSWRPLPACIRFLFIPPTAGLVLLGLWFFAGKVTNNFFASSALAAAWLAVTLLTGFLIARSFRDLAVPLAIALIGTWAVAGGYLAWTTLRVTVVHERIAVASPRSGNVQLAGGRFTSGEHRTTGRAVVVRLRTGGRVLTLDLRTSPGPDLRVYLAPGDGRDVGDHRDLGALKGDRGTQQYDLPPDVDLRRYTAVVIYCRAFSAPFGAAVLRAPA